MKKIATFTAVLVAAASLGIMASSCSKVDCDAYCDKMVECFVDIFAADKSVSKIQEKFMQEQAKKWSKKCKDDCKKKKGRGRDAGDINKCLKKKDCKEFAKCMKPLLKK